MKVVIPGGSGQVGTILARAFHAERHEVVVLSRRVLDAPWRTVQWDAISQGHWGKELDGADVVINLAGRNVNSRYTDATRAEILQSRVASTRAVGVAISKAAQPPNTWLQASTATIYAHRFDAPNDEATGILGGAELDAPRKWGFSIEVAKAWEKAMDDAVVPKTRKIKMRSAMIMSPDRGGIFDTLLTLIRFGLGGRVGNGEQYVSWIHEGDFVRTIHWLIEHKEFEGTLNIAVPNPIPYSEFMRTLRGVWGMPIGLPSTKWMLEIGTFVLGTESELVLKSRRVVPGRLLEAGFTFRYPNWSDAADDLVRRWKGRSRKVSAT
jgi:uncharacterized protein (TIGR01777 family)